MQKFLVIVGTVMAVGYMMLPSALAADLKFSEVFGMSTPFSVDAETGEPTRNVVRGVPAALQPWWVKNGKASVRDNGTITARVRYLVFAGGNAIGTKGPINEVVLTLFCGTEDSTEHSTAPLALEPEGMLKIKKEPLTPAPPADCENPALLVRISNAALPWIAAFALEDE